MVPLALAALAALSIFALAMVGRACLQRWRRGTSSSLSLLAFSVFGALALVPILWALVLPYALYE